MLKARALVDHKDKGMSEAMVGAVGSSRIAEISRGIARIRQDEGNLVAIVLNGDLTTRGDVPGYEACLTFLHGALQLSDREYWKHRRLLAVPGNHDVNRGAIVSGQPLLEKFKPLLDQWTKIFGACEFLTVDAPSPTDLPTRGSGASAPSIRFLPLNTCFLCGEYRAFPAEIKDKVLELLNELKKTVPPAEFEKIVSEQIDCPAVSRDHVSALEEHISTSDADTISVVVGHHPLFAQPMPRIDGYNELLNAGYIREAVLETRRNIVYLHGHIHQDPLLLVSSPMRGPHRIIHISAPALQDGFNLIRIFFSNATNQPLGLELVQYRFGDHLGLRKLDPIKIRLMDQGALWNEIDHPWVKYVLDQLASPQTIKRFGDLVREVPASMSEGVDISDQRQAVTSALALLELLEIIEITNRDSAAALWQCHRKSI